MDMRGTPAIVTAITLILLFFSTSAFSQNSVGIGTENPNSNAALDIVSQNGNQGVLLPRLTTAQRTGITGLTDTDNGLIVYDSDLNKFFYWHSGSWNEIGGAVSGFVAGNGIQINGNTITNLGDLDSNNEIQDLELTGNTLRITNNTNATDIDLSPFAGTNTDNQTLTLVTTDLSISGGNSVDLSSLINDSDADPANEIQNLSVSGNAINISGGTGANLSTNAPAGGQVLKWDGANWTAGPDNTGTGAPQLNNGEILAGNGASNFAIAMGGDVTFTSGTGAVDLNAGVVGTTEIADGTITNADINNSAGIAAIKLQPTVMVEGENVSLLANDAGYLTTGTLSVDLNDINAGGAAPGEVLEFNGTNWAPGTDDVNDADANPANEIQSLSLGGTDLTISGGNTIDLSPSFPSSLPPSGAAGGDLTGTYPNPTVGNNAITSAKIGPGQVNSSDVADNSLVNADINAAAAIAGTKISPNFGNQNVQTTGRGIFDRVQLTNSPTNGYVLTSDASGNGSWLPVPPAFTLVNQIPRGNGSGMVSSNMYSDGLYIGIGTAAPVRQFHVFDEEPDLTGQNGVFVDIQNKRPDNGAMAGIRFKSFDNENDEDYKAAILFQKFCDVCSTGLGSIKFAVNSADDNSNVGEVDTQMEISGSSVSVKSSFIAESFSEFNDGMTIRDHMWMGSSGPGTSGQVLTSNGVGTWPTWEDNSGSFATLNFIPKGDGAGMVSSAIYDNGTFIGINRTTTINASTYLAFDVPTTGTAYGGMYINSVSATGRPFYGYARGGSAVAWTYLDGGNNKWHINYGGDRLTVQSNGNVGIGNISPSERLTIAGNVLSTGDVIDEGAVGTNSDHWITRHVGAPTASNIEWRTSIRGNNQDYWIYAYNGSTFSNFLKFDYSTGDTRFDEGDVYSGNDIIANEFRSLGNPTNSYFGWLTTNEFRIRANNNHAMTVQSDGRVRLGTIQFDNDPARVIIQRDAGSDTHYLIMQNTFGTGVFNFTVGGEAEKPGGGPWAATSDIRVKKNVRKLEYGLKEALEINPVTFQYNELSGFDDTEKQHFGVIAQEIQEVIPESVSIKEGGPNIEDLLIYDGSAIPYVLINAIKELNSKVESLEARIDELESNKKELESELKARNSAEQ